MPGAAVMGADQRRAAGVVGVAPGEPAATRGRRDPQASDEFLRQGDPVNLYPFIEAEKTQQHNVKRTCERLEVSRAAYYANGADSPSTRQLVDDELTDHIRQAHQTARGRYGAPRIHAQLRRGGHRHGRKRIARLMRAPACTDAPRAASSARRLPTRLPRLVRIWCAGTSPWTPRRSTPAGAGTSPTSRPGRAGCTWRR